MIVYADTSALAKLFLEEDGSGEMRVIAHEAEATATVSVAYVELRAAVAAAIRNGRVRSALRDSLTNELERVWNELAVVAIDSSLLQRAGNLAEQMRLRACDAIHVTALQEWGKPGEITFACWDGDLRDAARSLGYPLFPA